MSVKKKGPGRPTGRKRNTFGVMLDVAVIKQLRKMDRKELNKTIESFLKMLLKDANNRGI